MTDQYFSERENGAAPRINDAINDRVWGGLFALISAKEGDHSFGYRFPDQCPDGSVWLRPPVVPPYCRR
jgi:hypothetical protein